jgi:hypothetical protein
VELSDAWEQGFDSWTPRGDAAAGEDTDTDLQRAELLRLARELAARREPGARDDELEALKRSLRERAEAIAVRERELERLQKKVDGGRSFFRRPAADEEAVAARERAALERAQALDARERETEARVAALEAEAARLAEREAALATELSTAQARVAETEAERELAARERERLEERDKAAHEVEKSLATLRIALEARERELEAQMSALESRAAALDAAARAEVEHETRIEHGAAERAEELEQREAKLAARERELLLLRQGIDADRNALLERERALRRREVAEVRESFAPPLAPPSFSEGLAAFARLRSRG